MAKKIKKQEEEIQETTTAVATEKETELTDIEVYEKFVALKFLQLGGAQLNKESIDELAKLEAKVKASKGQIAKRTCAAAISNEILRLVEGCPMPAKYAKIIEDKGEVAKKHYFA